MLISLVLCHLNNIILIVVLGFKLVITTALTSLNIVYECILVKSHNDCIAFYILFISAYDYVTKQV